MGEGDSNDLVVCVHSLLGYWSLLLAPRPWKLYLRRLLLV